MRTDASTGALAPFRRPGFSAYAASSAAMSLSWSISSIVFSWLTLETTDEPFAVGAVFAVRIAALLVFGIPAGVLADRTDRRLLIIMVSGGGALIGLALAVAVAAGSGFVDLWVIVVASFALGVFDTIRLAAGNAYAFDLVGPLLATSGIALANLVAQLTGIVGNLAGGEVIARMGPAVALGLMSAALVAGGLVLVFAPRPPAAHRERHAQAPGSLRRSLTILQRNRILALLALAVIVTEVFGFSSMTLLPVFARDVFGAGPDAYGTLSAVRSLGGVVGLLILARIGAGWTRGSTLLGISGVFGIALIGLAVSPSILLAILPLALIGASSATSDSLSQSLMQRTTPDSERGASMGVWAFAVGFGPFGHLAVGAAASSVGAPITQLLAGLVLCGLAVALAFNRALRQLR